MVTLLVTSLFFLVVISLAIYLWQRPASHKPTEQVLLPPRHNFRGLFSGEDSIIDSPARIAENQSNNLMTEQRAVVQARAAHGEKEALRDAHDLNNKDLYGEVLNRLLAQTNDSDESLRALVGYIVEHRDLRANRELAEAFFRVWKDVPDRASTARMLRVAALSDDAEMFRKAIEAAVELRRSAQLNFSAEDLLTLIESEYWLLAPEARSSGAGFVLKETIAELRGEKLPQSRG